MSYNNTALNISRMDAGPNGFGDPLRRIRTGTDANQNSALSKQVRCCPIDTYQWLLHTYGNPQLQGQEDWRPMPRVGFGELQDMYAQRFKVNDARQQLELYNTRDRRHIIRNDVTMDNIPTFTMGSDWFRAANEKIASNNGGRGRMLFNRGRIYGQ